MAEAAPRDAAPRTRRLSWREALPPLMVYLAAGLSGLTGIVGTFFVKERLGLSAESVASLGFWISLPWTLKMALGHLVDLAWRHKGLLVAAGAALAFASTAILYGLVVQPAALTAAMTAEAWYVWSALLGPAGYVLQDVVADAMTVDAVPRTDAHGAAVAEADARRMHTTMQALSRGTLIAGGLLVALINLAVFGGGGDSAAARADAYRHIVGLALAIPLLSVLGVAAASLWPSRPGRRPPAPPARADPLLLGGGVAFAAVSLALGAGRVPHAELWVFLLSLAILVGVMRRLLARLDPDDRHTLLGTATALFVFRAMPDPGPGPGWWMIDRLHVDERFFALLSVLGSVLALAGLLAFRRWMAQRSVAFTIVALSLAWTVLALPGAGLYFGLHEWTAARTGGLVDGRAIVVTDAAALSLLSEIAMVPMLAWIARTAPERLKATYFAVMVSFVNLGFLLSRLGSRYLNGVFVVTREVRGAGGIVVPADYGQLGPLVLTSMAITLLVPLATIVLLARTRYRSG